MSRPQRLSRDVTRGIEPLSQANDVERQLRKAGLNAERDELRRLAGARQIDEETAWKLIREIDLQELRYV